jgi:probable HAF family extracellular repeat protein
MKDLGTLGGHYSGANNVNASGQVVGYSYLAGDSVAHTFLWRNDGGKMLDVNALIDPTDPLKPYVTLNGGESGLGAQDNPVYITDSGDILSEGTDTRTGHLGLYLLQGTLLTLAPRSLGFGDQPVNTSSAAKSVTLTNTAPKVVAIDSIAVTGTAAGLFVSTNNCGRSLTSHATCTIKVTFKPTTKGTKSATLDVNGGGGGLRSVKLTGTGT